MSIQQETSIIQYPTSEDHPLAHVTSRNDESHFLRLPLEVRIMIYEYVLAVGKPVRPTQVTTRSNKFVWGRHGKAMNYNIYPNRVTARNLEDCLLDVVSLEQVCRKTYHDLQVTPVFYKVNTFHFDFAEDLHLFLAAITPKRRESIRYLELSTRGVWDYLDVCRVSFPGWTFEFTDRPPHKTSTLILTLLSQCKDLKEFDLILKREMTPENLMAISTIPLDTPSPWNLPFLRAKVELLPQEYYTFGQSDKISRRVLRQLAPYGDWEIHRRWFMEFNSKMVVRRKQAEANENERPQWLTDLHTKELIEEAVAAANIDFPGEIRVSQNRLDSTLGPISNRTRRSNWIVDRSTGVLTSAKPKYSADGSLVIWKYELIGVRWNESSEVECKLRFSEPANDPTTSWELVEKVAFTSRGERALRAFYGDTISYADLAIQGNTQAVLARLRTIPPPAHVLKSLGGVENIIRECQTSEVLDINVQMYKDWWEVTVLQWTSLMLRLEAGEAANAD
ncbi:hypothetical protein F4805DRAFT_477268 [Annulohypoxylon moriforme]|nr:hypothetical protein F4805DRAFT_477268 [Annulohypoxylon moriforme]